MFKRNIFLSLVFIAASSAHANELDLTYPGTSATPTATQLFVTGAPSMSTCKVDLKRDTLTYITAAAETAVSEDPTLKVLMEILGPEVSYSGGGVTCRRDLECTHSNVPQLGESNLPCWMDKIRYVTRVTAMNFRNTFCMLALLGCAGSAGASDFGLHLGSKHGLLQPNGKELNDTNPGVYVRQQGYTLGVYRNSWSGVTFQGETHERWSVHASRDFSARVTDSVEASLSLGIVTGYPVAAVLPLVLPSIRFGGDFGVRVSYIAKVLPAQTTDTVHLSTEWRF